MTADPCSLALDISEPLFKLTTESVRLRSNETRSHQTLAGLVTERIDDPRELDDQSPDTIREHLSMVPTSGDIRINLVITKSSADSLDEVKRRMSEKLGSNITLGDTLSILLFNYIVGQKTAHVMQRLGLDEQENGAGATSVVPDAPGGNVVPLR